MVRLSDTINPEGGQRPARAGKKPDGQSLPEILIITTSTEIVNMVRQAVEVRGYRMRHFQSFDEALRLIRTSARVLPVIDGDLEGARDFIDELSASGPVQIVAIVPDRDTAEFFSGIPGLQLFTRPVEEDELLAAIRELSGPVIAASTGAGETPGTTLFAAPPAAADTPAPPPGPEIPPLPVEPPARPAAGPAETGGDKPELPPAEAAPPPDRSIPITADDGSGSRDKPADESTTPSPEPPPGAARMTEMVPAEPPAGVKRPVIPDHDETPPAGPPPAPAGADTSDDLAVQEELYARTVDILHRFLSGHRSRSNPPLNEVTGIVEEIITRLHDSREICLQVISSRPDFSNADRYLATHMANVTLLAARLGMGRDYEAKKLFELTLAAAVHDLGMTQLPEGLITRQGKLDQAGYSQIKQHPSFGRKLLEAYAGAYPWLPDVVYQEHERHDGSGYPEGLTGRDIHPYASIIGLVDTYEALTNLRPFRDRMIPFNVLQQLIRLGGQLFPSELVKSLIEEISVFPLGSYVRLNTGEICRVQEINRGYPLRPAVQVLYASDGSALEQGRTIDLKAEPMLYITGPEDIRESKG